MTNLLLIVMRMQKRFRFPAPVRHLFVCSLILCSAAACTRTEATPGSGGGTSGAPSGAAAGSAGGRGGAPAAVPVVTAPVEVRTMPVTLDAVGTVEAITTVEVRAQAAGQLREVHFTPGQEVRKDQLLFTIDPGPFEATVRQAEAVLARDTAQANDARAQRSRLESLLSRGLIPREQFETQTANVAALEATMAADQAQVDQARLNLKYARITAPIAGRTGALMSHAGDLVRVNDTNPLVTINQLSPIYVTFSVPARLLTDIRHYQSRGPLTVAATAQSAAPRGGQAGAAPTTDGASGGEGPPAAAQPAASAPTAQGQVSFIDNAVAPTTATIKLKGTFANTDRSLWPGLFVQVALQLS